MTSIEPLIGIPEVAKLLSCSTMAVRKWTREGLIPHYRIGMGDPNKKMYKFRKSEVMEWLESKRYKKVERRYHEWHKGTVIRRSYE